MLLMIMAIHSDTTSLQQIARLLRKVRCDRVQPVCGSCARLQLNCSFQRRSVTPDPETGDDSVGYTGWNEEEKSSTGV